MTEDELDRVMEKHDLDNKKVLDFTDFKRIFVMESPTVKKIRVSRVVEDEANH
jgi:hypothetical protein